MDLWEPIALSYDKLHELELLSSPHLPTSDSHVTWRADFPAGNVESPFPPDQRVDASLDVQSKYQAGDDTMHETKESPTPSEFLDSMLDSSCNGPEHHIDDGFDGVDGGAKHEDTGMDGAFEVNALQPGKPGTCADALNAAVRTHLVEYQKLDFTLSSRTIERCALIDTTIHRPGWR